MEKARKSRARLRVCLYVKLCVYDVNRLSVYLGTVIDLAGIMSHTKFAQIGPAARLLQLTEVGVFITLSIQLLAVAGVGAFRE